MTIAEMLKHAKDANRRAERFLDGPGAGDTARARAAAQIAEAWANIATSQLAAMAAVSGHGRETAQQFMREAGFEAPQS